MRISAPARLRAEPGSGLDAALLDAVVDRAVVGIDDAGRIVAWNRAATELLGYEVAQVLGERAGALLAEVAGEEALETAAQDGRVEFRTWLSSRGGARVRVQAVLSALRDAAGSISGYALVLRPPDELDHRRLLRVIECTTDLVGLADTQGNLVYQNPAGNRLIGWDADVSLEGKRISDVHPPSVARFIREQGIPAALRDGSWSDETALLHVDGTLIPVLQSINVHRDENGHPEFFSTIIRDIRPLKQAHAIQTKVAAQVPGTLFQLLAHPDGTMQVTYVSAGLEEMFGVSFENPAMTAVGLRDGVDPADRDAMRRAFVVSAQQLSPFSAEYRYRHPVAGLRWHRADATPERLPDGSHLWHGFASDITDQRLASDEVRVAKERLEEAINAIDAGFAMYDADLRIVTWNARYAAMFSVPQRVLKPGTRMEELVRAILEAHGRSADAPLQSDPTMTFLEHRMHRMRTSSGYTDRFGDRWVRVDIRRSAAGGTVVLCTDVTALKQAEFDARVQEQRLRLATGAAEIGVWDLDLLTYELVWDERMYEIYECTHAELGGHYKGWCQRVHADDLGHAEATLQQCLAAEVDYKDTFRIQTPTGAIRHVEVRGGELRDATGKAIRLVGVAVDITERVEAETRLRNALLAAQAATRAKAEFLATMSHEIRTPMNGVIGMTNLLIETSLDSDQRECVETIRSSGEALLTLINDILDFSKIEAGKLQLEQVPFDLEREIAASISLLADVADKKGIELRYEAPAERHPWVTGDPTRLRQIVLNLLSNAIKFTARGWVRVGLDLRATTPGAVEVVLEVQDTGIGMAASHVARLGEAFSQADASTTRRFGGSGLGLSICKSLVRMMSGTLDVESAVGRGSLFRVVVPMRRESSSAAAGQEPCELESVRLGRVLVVEDNIVNQRVVCRMLEPHVDAVDVACNGREGVERFAQRAYDCVLMDGQMPEMDGFEATRWIRAFERQHARARTPVIALTANALPGDREIFLAAGMDEYLTKPIRKQDLAVALARVGRGELGTDDARR